MSTNIYQFNGALLVSVADGALNTTAAPIAFPGKGYTNYGAPVLQDVLWTMQNFAGSVAPSPLLQGINWYDTNANELKVYTGTVWSAMFKDNQTNSPSVNLTYDLGTNSLKFNNIYVGTVHATTVNATTLTGPTNIFYTTQTNLPSVNATFDLGSSSFKFNAIYATTIEATNITGATNLFYNNQTNLPTITNTYDLGSSSFVFGNVYATTFHGTATQAQYADVAERYAADSEMEVGDVVRLGGDAEITITTTDCDTFVFGVISDKPALQMNSKAGTDATHPYVALLGRTPCKVIGRCAKGDRLVSSSTPGVARAADGGEDPHCVIGRALATKQTDDVGLVEIVIGRA